MRKENWVDELNAYFESMEDAKFEQGVIDCGHFVGDAVVAMTGEDRFFEFRGKYNSVQGYMRLLHKFGFDRVEQYLDYNFDRLGSVFRASRGDIVIRIENGLEALGICNGRHSVFLKTEGGLAYVKTIECKAAWRVE